MGLMAEAGAGMRKGGVFGGSVGCQMLFRGCFFTYIVFEEDPSVRCDFSHRNKQASEAIKEQICMKLSPAQAVTSPLRRDNKSAFHMIKIHLCCYLGVRYFLS